MAENITVLIDERTLKDIQIKLGSLEKKTPNVLKNAINMAARKTRKMLPEKARERYTIKGSKMKKNISLTSASISNLGAKIKVKGRPHQLIYFQTRKNGVRMAAKARGRNDRSLKELISSTGGKAFITTIDNGEDQNGNRNRKHRTVLQRLTKSRYPLVTLAGPSDPEMLGNQDVYGNLEPSIQQELMKSINKQIQRVIGGGR